MHSSFDTSRIFNDQTGWYVIMRPTDEKYLHGPKHKLIGKQHMMGPFNSKHQVEEWLEGYISMHGENRDTDTFIPDSAATFH